MSAISIIKGSIKLAGLLYKPTSTTFKVPGIVVIHPGGGVKEQTASIYARHLSERGYVAIAYDASHQGDSEGLPRFLEDPAARITDASAVADYLERLDYVDANRIFVVGICAGGGYAVAVAKGDHRFRAVAIVSAVNGGDGSRCGIDGKGNPANAAATLDQVAQGIQTEVQSNASVTVPIIPPKGEDRSRDMLDTHEYYFTSRGQHPNSQNKMLLRSLPLIMTWDAWAYADILLTQPLLIVVGEKSTNKWHSDRIFELLDGKNKGMKRVVWPNAYHIDLYDKKDYVEPTVKEIDELFRAESAS
ncbi:Alpha/Beta hydrolase protein [Aspergillus carlsbadensis]|nr:Alpha/Beta hydrolase protein [Aspergillus carlsbadensis]